MKSSDKNAVKSFYSHFIYLFIYFFARLLARGIASQIPRNTKSAAKIGIIFQAVGICRPKWNRQFHSNGMSSSAEEKSCSLE